MALNNKLIHIRIKILPWQQTKKGVDQWTPLIWLWHHSVILNETISLYKISSHNEILNLNLKAKWRSYKSQNRSKTMEECHEKVNQEPKNHKMYLPDINSKVSVGVIHRIKDQLFPTALHQKTYYHLLVKSKRYQIWIR